MGNATMMDRTLDVILPLLDKAPLLVSSAMTKVTDALVRIADLAAKAEQDEVAQAVEQLHQHHLKAAEELLGVGTKEHSACKASIDAMFAELGSISRGLCLIREVSPRSRDALLGFGERLSTTMLYHRSIQRGVSAEFLDARTVVKTDENFNSANLLKEPTYKAIQAALSPRPGHLIITQGFIGSTLSGVGTTLGRGGSDWSATIFGAALKAEEVQIWTDVDGIMTTDPRLVPGAKVLPEISYTEAAELAYFGAKVIHPATIMPAVELGIPVWVKNTKNPQAVGTKICTGTELRGVQAIAGKKGITLVTVRSSRMLNAYGFLRSIFQVFEEHRVSVDLIATSEVSVSVTIDDTTHLKSLRRDLERFADVTIDEHKAIVCLVGRDLWRLPDFVSRTFTALGTIPVQMVTMGSSDNNLSLVVPQEHLDASIKILHQAHFGI